MNAAGGQGHVSVAITVTWAMTGTARDGSGLAAVAGSGSKSEARPTRNLDGTSRTRLSGGPRMSAITGRPPARQIAAPIRNAEPCCLRRGGGSGRVSVVTWLPGARSAPGPGCRGEPRRSSALIGMALMMAATDVVRAPARPAARAATPPPFGRPAAQAPLRRRLRRQPLLAAAGVRVARPTPLLRTRVSWGGAGQAGVGRGGWGAVCLPPRPLG
jgi:hypothetical protein